MSIIGTTDKFTLTNWYLGNQCHVEQFKTSDGKVLLDSAVQTWCRPWWRSRHRRLGNSL